MRSWRRKRRSLYSQHLSRHHVLLVRLSVDHIESLERAVAEPGIELNKAMAPCTAPLSSSPGLSQQYLGLGSPAVPVWLITPCSCDGLGGVAAGTVGAWTSDGDMRLDR